MLPCNLLKKTFLNFFEQSTPRDPARWGFGGSKKPQSHPSTLPILPSPQAAHSHTQPGEQPWTARKKGHKQWIGMGWAAWEPPGGKIKKEPGKSGCVLKAQPVQRMQAEPWPRFVTQQTHPGWSKSLKERFYSWQLHQMIILRKISK